MFNLSEIVIGLAVLVTIISIWALYYFIGRIYFALRYRWHEREHLKQVGMDEDSYSPTVISHRTHEQLAYKVKQKK